MEHQYMKPGDHDCDPDDNCLVCDGGLAICKVCNLGEGTLTTDCPGEKVDMDKADLIYTGKLDFREGQGWVNEMNPINEQRKRHFGKYHNKFKHFKPETVQATENLISAKPWLWNPEALGQWLKKASDIYQLPCPSLIISPELSPAGCYIQDFNLIILPKCSIFTLLHEFRHAMQLEGDEEDARGWSCSLVYQTNPRFFRNAVRKGLVLYC